MIYGKRIRLRAVEREDLPYFVEWLNDPEVRQYLTMNTPMSLASEQGWFENMLKTPLQEHPMVIEIRTEEAWKAVGNISFVKIDWPHRSAEVGIFIGEKSEWGKGYGTEAMRLMLRHGFNTYNLNRIALRVYATNPRGIRAYEKAGYVLEGRLRQALYSKGEYIDELVMSVLRSEWKDEE